MSTTINPSAALAVQQDAPPGPALAQDAANGGDGDPVHAYGSGDGRTAVLEERELKALLEALLFVSHEPVSIDRLMAALGHTSPSEVRPALQHLGEDFDREGRGLQLVEVAGGVQLATRPAHAPGVKRLDRARSVPQPALSALESLPIL